MHAWIIDAFADERFEGNPAAVVLGTEFPSTDRMQATAMRLGVPTTAFLTADGGQRYNIRWFTPRAELDLCGHATLASAFYLHEVAGEDGAAELCFQTRASGRLYTKWSDRFIALDLPRMDALPCAPPPGLQQALGAQILRCARASDDILVELGSVTEVRDLQPSFELLARFDCRGHVVTAQADDGCADFVSRSFFPALGVDEDQVCVSAHCKLAPYWAARLGKQRMQAIQLSARGGQLKLELAGDRVRVSGTAAVRGPVRLSPPDQPS